MADALLITITVLIIGGLGLAAMSVITQRQSEQRENPPLYITVRCVGVGAVGCGGTPLADD